MVLWHFWGEHRTEPGKSIAALTSLLACTSNNWSASASATSCSHSWLLDSCRPVSLFLCLWCRAPSSVEDPPGWTTLNSPSFPSCREMSEGVWRSCLSCEWLSCHRVCSCGAHTIRSIPINHTTYAISQKKNWRNIVNLCKIAVLLKKIGQPFNISIPIFQSCTVLPLLTKKCTVAKNFRYKNCSCIGKY